MELANKKIVLGLTGGIACYKLAEYVRRAQEQGAIIDVVMTEAATKFITPTTMQALTGRPVWMDAWDNRSHNSMAHINLSRDADAILIAPASTDFIAKLANGMANDLLSTLCIARGSCPLMVAPAMNREMWANPATQRNIRQLHEDNIYILGPAQGDQACGEIGSGRMLEANELLNETIGFFKPKPLAGINVLITAGPTAEPIDPVRVISNRSSGKTGYQFAKAAQQAGANVLLVSGPTILPTPYKVTKISVETAIQMHQAVTSNLDSTDIFISVAAVADWRVANPSSQKIKKDENQPGMPDLEFVANPDILAEVAARPDAPYCVGFAAETENLIENASSKRKRKGVPLLIGNLVQEAMNTDDTQVYLFDENGYEKLAKQSKQSAAEQLISAIANKFNLKNISN